MHRRCFFALLAAAPARIFAQPLPHALVVTADSADYLYGSGGTLAQLALDGYQIYIAQFGNDEKASARLSQPDTRWANVQEALAAAEFLGFRDTVRMGHKSGEIGYVSTTEMRKQLFALIRYLKPEKIFIPDPYAHYQPDWDLFFVGRMAEEAWGYSGSGTFAPELARMGLEPHRVPEVYYYPVGRPYRPTEGGERNARLVAVDITATMEAKRMAAEMLRTRNRQYALEVKTRLRAAGKSVKKLEPLDEAAVERLARSWIDDLAAATGAKHGLRYAEEFNYVGPGDRIPPHARERARRNEQR